MMKLPNLPSRTTPNFAFSTLGRAISEGLARRQFNKSEMKEVLDFFGSEQPACVYCGNPEVKRWDHLISISNGGETILGNIVPACQKCDDSKQDEDFEKWIHSNVDGSPKSRGVKNIDQRIEKIHQYIKHFGFNHQPLQTRLTESEGAKLGELRLKMKGLQREIESFISEFRKRNKLK